MSHCNSAKLFAPTACPSGVCFQTSAKRRLNSSAHRCWAEIHRELSLRRDGLSGSGTDGSQTQLGGRGVHISGLTFKENSIRRTVPDNVARELPRFSRLSRDDKAASP